MLSVNCDCNKKDKELEGLETEEKKLMGQLEELLTSEGYKKRKKAIEKNSNDLVAIDSKIQKTKDVFSLVDQLILGTEPSLDSLEPVKNLLFCLKWLNDLKDNTYDYARKTNNDNELKENFKKTKLVLNIYLSLLENLKKQLELKNKNKK